MPSSPAVLPWLPGIRDCINLECGTKLFSKGHNPFRSWRESLEVPFRELMTFSYQHVYLHVI
jgi:hypothetical protein